MMSCTISVKIKFALVYGQEDRVWLQVAAFFLAYFDSRKALL